jgi:tetratricopeptide (TPR) repeat protein
MSSRVRCGFAIPAIALAAFIAGATVPLARSAPPQLVPIPNGISLARRGNWVDTTRRHEPGRADDAARHALTFTAAELSGVLFDVQAGRLPVGRLDVPNVLARGAVLHTDVAVAQLRGAQKADQASQGGLASLHLWMAEGLVWQLASRVPSHPLVGAWFLAAGALLSSQLEVAETPAFLDRALTILPADPQLLLLAGAARELRASPRVQDASDLSAATRREVGDARQNLRRAEEFYRGALRAAPTQIEARIRLGRVLGLSGRHAEALAELETAARAVVARVGGGGSVERPLLYYLALFLGEEEEVAGQVDAARRSYARALELYPAAASAHLDLSRLEWRSGRRDLAATAISRMTDIGRPARPGDEPWRDYFCAGPARDVDHRLAALGPALEWRQ